MRWSNGRESHAKGKWLLQHKEDGLVVQHVQVQKRNNGHAHRLKQRLEEQQRFEQQRLEWGDDQQELQEVEEEAQR